MVAIGDIEAVNLGDGQRVVRVSGNGSSVLMPSIGSGSYVMNCRHCGGSHSDQCPRVKTIDYYEDGTVKRVEYRD